MLVTKHGLILFLVIVLYVKILYGQRQTQNTYDLEQIVQSIEHGKQSNEITKCGLDITFNILEHWNEFSLMQKQRLQKALASPMTQKDRVIGHFHIYYDTTGTSTPSLLNDNGQPLPGTTERYIDSVGKIFNYVWSYEINSLKYSQPPVETDGFYKIVVRDTGYYGLTMFESELNTSNPTLWSTYIIIDNDYKGFFSPGMSGLKVTAAHEFHHAIQLGAYGFWGESEQYYYEITSTWMEDVVFNDVNDYYQYIKSSSIPAIPRGQFATPAVSFTFANGLIEYSRAIWGKFIEKRYSRDVMRRSWELIRQEMSLPAIDHALSEVGGSFRMAFLEFAYWNYFTGSRWDSVYYVEGKSYPLIRERDSSYYYPPHGSFRDSIQVISSAYLPIRLQSERMMTIISNINVSAVGSLESFRYDYSLSQNPIDGAKHLSNGLYAKILAPDLQNWISQESVPSVVAEVVVYPNPFHGSSNKRLKFRLPSALQTSALPPMATLYVFSSSIDMVFTGDLPIINLQPLEAGLAWDGRSESGDPVATGVYIFVIKVGDSEYNGKFSVIRE